MKNNRLSRVIRNMESAGLSQILVYQTESIYYLTDLWLNPGERLQALWITADGACTLFVNHMFAVGDQCKDLRLVEFDDVDDPIALIAAEVKPGILGIDKFWPSGFTIRLLEQRPDLTLKVGSAPVDTARMFKDAEEIAAMRISSHMNDQVVDYLRKAMTEGETEADIGRKYTAKAISLGAMDNGFTPLVCFGANCAEPHHNTDNTPLRKGDAVILDVGLNYQHMLSDMTRTVFYGSVTDEERKVYELVKAANAAGKAAVRPGVRLCDIDRAARKVIEDAGYGPYFLHRTGHGIGLSVHEPPDCSSSNELIAAPGMVFSIEPGIYLSGKFGVRIEDLVTVTEDGCEVLNELDRDLMIV